MSGGDVLDALLAPYQSLSLTCGFLFDSAGDIVRPLLSNELREVPGSPFKKALDELERIGTVAGSIELRLFATLGVAVCVVFVLELAGRRAIPSSMNRLLRCPSGSWPVVGEGDTAEATTGSFMLVVGMGGLPVGGRSRSRGLVYVEVAEDMRCRVQLRGQLLVESQQGGEIGRD